MRPAIAATLDFPLPGPPASTRFFHVGRTFIPAACRACSARTAAITPAIAAFTAANPGSAARSASGSPGPAGGFPPCSATSAPPSVGRAVSPSGAEACARRRAKVVASGLAVRRGRASARTSCWKPLTGR